MGGVVRHEQAPQQAAKLVREVCFPPVRGAGVQQRPLGGVIGRPSQRIYETRRLSAVSYANLRLGASTLTGSIIFN